jgi:hypothetical protein
MSRVLFLSFALSLACNEYQFKGPADAEPGADSGSASGDETGPSSDGPPEDSIEDCEPGTVATFDSGEIYILSWDPYASAPLIAEEAGTYHLYDFSIAESESSQRNESAYLRITNATNPEGTPVFSNCEVDWVVMDNDNDQPPVAGTRIYMGTFWLDAGVNTLELHHLCTYIREGLCTDMHDEEDPESTCESSNANSVHYLGEGICLQEN